MTLRAQTSLLSVLAFATSLLPPATACAQTATAPSPSEGNRLTIHLERDRNGRIEPMRPDHVFDSGDVVRFRLTAAQDGYLYVLDQGSSGSYTVLFPAADSAAGNRIERGHDYTVPAEGEGWFSIDPPAGFDTVYFLLSPTPLAPLPAGGNPSATPAPAANAPLNPALRPRCNDQMFRARGECIDTTAGPAPLPRGAVLPPQITLAAPHASRDLVLEPEDDGTTVAATAPANTPVVYTFRLAHR